MPCGVADRRAVRASSDDPFVALSFFADRWLADDKRADDPERIRSSPIIKSDAITKERLIRPAHTPIVSHWQVFQRSRRQVLLRRLSACPYCTSDTLASGVP